MHGQPAETADTWRGALTALALVALLAGLFALFAFAFDGELPIPDTFKQQPAPEGATAPPADTPNGQKPRSANVEAKKAESNQGESRKDESKKAESKKDEEQPAQSPASRARADKRLAGAQVTSKPATPISAASEPADGSRSTAAHPPASAAEALSQVLKSYKAVPNRTTTVSITSLGHIGPQHDGAPTFFDGLPTAPASQSALTPHS
jgi:hypothetical protein